MVGSSLTERWLFFSLNGHCEIPDYQGTGKETYSVDCECNFCMGLLLEKDYTHIYKTVCNRKK